MDQYWVEGMILPKKKKNGAESFHKSFWANSPREALEEALRSEPGVTWLEGPRIAKKSEEQRMRELGAPQLPGFGAPIMKPAPGKQGKLKNRR
jgi:hypothetical protein